MHYGQKVAVQRLHKLLAKAIALVKRSGFNKKDFFKNNWLIFLYIRYCFNNERSHTFYIGIEFACMRRSVIFVIIVITTAQKPQHIKMVFTYTYFLGGACRTGYLYKTIIWFHSFFYNNNGLDCRLVLYI